MLTLRDVRAYYETPRGTVKAVDDVSLEVRKNEILGIAGESGCGKSTLLKVMYGYVEWPLKLVSGQIRAEMEENGQVIVLNGNNLREGWWRFISYIPQGSMSVLNPVVRIETQFFDAISRFHQVGDKQLIRAQLIDYLKELGLPSEILRAYPHQLSGGMKQRILVALATFLHPKIVLADEPTTALDVVVQRGILRMLTQVQQRMQNTLLVVSHDMGVHYQISHRMAIMYAGRIVELGLTEMVFNRPLHPYTDLLIKSLPRIGDRTKREGIAGAPPSLLNLPSGCRFAPRCPFAMDICRQIDPQLLEIEPRHYVACHLRQ
ncbi:MAG: ABC transporter ATP-binding protein [Anaerolineae bacterium]|nr:ABC transporter ATP-binding protein [Anaerolineae bacterium]MDW8097941.1 ABC transporter ATP-binding protein [Anaerolineae bacterium]